MRALQDYLRMFARLRVNRVGGSISPHKPCLLLAVMDLVEAGAITDARIRYTPTLLEIFSEYFALVARTRDRNRPYYPFFHLKSEPFWKLVVEKGGDKELALIAVPSHRAMEEIVTYAAIDPDLFHYMQALASREALREEIIVRWFPDPHDRVALRNQVALHSKSNAYERTLRGRFDEVPMVRDEPLPSTVRDRAFRNLVLEAYDYRCAASGWRVIVPDGTIMVQAAHLIPHADSHDNDPRNGIALTPNFHWALDRHIIAPGPDMKWHVSKVLDERIADNRPLMKLEGKGVFLPRKRSLYPRREALEWRLENLLGADG